MNERIESFKIDHTKLKKGVYIARVDGDVVTYDIRIVKPNTPPFLDNAGLHTLEHLLASYMRNSKYGRYVVYIGPMGCRTGFYLLMRDNVSHDAVLDLIRGACDYIMKFRGSVPGASEKECGNYREHDLNMARCYAKSIWDTLVNYTVSNMHYNNDD